MGFLSKIFGVDDSRRRADEQALEQAKLRTQMREEGLQRAELAEQKSLRDEQFDQVKEENLKRQKSNLLFRLRGQQEEEGLSQLQNPGNLASRIV